MTDSLLFRNSNGLSSPSLSNDDGGLPATTEFVVPRSVPTDLP